MTVRILNAEVLDGLAKLEDQSFDCIVTDPPYGQTNLRWDRWPGPEWLQETKRVLRPGGSMWVFGSMRMFIDHIGEFAGWKYAQDVVWEKHNGTNFHNDRFRRVHELAVQFYPEGVKWADVYRCPQYSNDATKRTIRKKARPAQWTGRTGPTEYQSEDGGPRLVRSVMYERSSHGRSLHPTQKPLGVVRSLVAYSCPVGGIVLDCFAGSGTTGVAAKELGCGAVLIEGNPEYCDVMERRMQLVIGTAA